MSSSVPWSQSKMDINEQTAGQIRPNVPKCSQRRTGMTERWKWKKKKSRHPAEEQPGYKSLNCEQKGESPSTVELLLFHCTFSRLTLHWTSRRKEARCQRSAWGICVVGFSKMSSLNFKSHNTLDGRPCRFFGISAANVERIKAAHFSKNNVWKQKKNNKKQTSVCLLDRMLGNPWNLFDWSQWIQPIPVGDGWLCTCGQKKKGLSGARIRR